MIDTSLDGSDGVQQYVKTLGEWLGEQGHNVHYLTSRSKLNQWKGGQVHALASAITVRFNANRVTIPLLARGRALSSLVASSSFDVLHVQMPYSPLLAGRLIARVPSSTAVVGTFHILPAGRLQSWATGLLGRLLRKTLRRFDGIISVSPAAAAFARQSFRLSSKVVPNTVDLTKFRVTQSLSDLQKKPKTIVFLGRLVERKGALELLDAFTLLHQTHPQVRLIIAGTGPLRPKIESIVEERKLQKFIELPGFIEEEKKPALLASSYVTCFPSLYGESFGIVLLEAMAAGGGVTLGGDNPGYRSVLGEQPKLLVEPKDTATFAARLAELLDNPALHRELHLWQQKHVTRFDVDQVGKQISSFYEQAIAKRRKNIHT